jgi:hypothetical protein
MTSAVQVQYRRGSAAQVGSYTGPQGEMVIDTTNNRVVVQDGATAGGWAAAKLSEVLTNARTQVSDGGYTVLATDRLIAYVALTAARAVALPAASTFPTGARLLVVDETGNCSATKTITLNRNGSDLIDGAATAVINTAYGYLAVESNGANSWTIIDQVASIPVPSVNGLTGAVSLAASGGDVITASGTTITIGGCGGLVNKFRNGTMDLWQRGTGSMTVTVSGAYAADGWIVLPSGASVSVTQSGGRLLTKNAMQVTGAASVTDIIVKQRIESLFAAAFSSQTVTVQAQVYNGTGGPITPTLTVRRAASQDVWTSPATDVNAVSLQTCPASAWTLLSWTFSANAASYNGLEIGFDFGNNFGANTKSVQITECDIRVTPGVATGLNSNPPPPELRPVAAEMPLCARFYQLGLTFFSAQVSATVASYYAVTNLPTVMRATPTVVFTNGGASGFGNTPSLWQATAYYVGETRSSSGTLTPGAYFYSNFTASAEL